MLWFIVMQLVSTLLQWTRLAKTSDHEKDLEILFLRRQLAILQRKVDSPIRVSRAEKLTLATLAARYKSVTGRSARQLQACPGRIFSSAMQSMLKVAFLRSPRVVMIQACAGRKGPSVLAIDDFVPQLVRYLSRNPKKPRLEEGPGPANNCW